MRLVVVVVVTLIGFRLIAKQWPECEYSYMTHLMLENIPLCDFAVQLQYHAHYIYYDDVYNSHYLFRSINDTLEIDACIS